MMSLFRSQQEEYFSRSCYKRFSWQTENQLVSELERDLLSCLPIAPGSRVLELGSGTASNLYNLRALGKHFSFVGADINEVETRFAQSRFPEDQFVLADAVRVSFSEGTFDLVFCRDLLHHLEVSQQAVVIKEMARVTKPGGKIVVIESNSRNFVINTFGRLFKQERGVLRSVPSRIETILRSVKNIKLIDPAPHYAWPSDLGRIMLHYQFGLPWIGRSALVRSAVHRFNRFAARRVSPEKWAYMIFTAIRS